MRLAVAVAVPVPVPVGIIAILSDDSIATHKRIKSNDTQSNFQANHLIYTWFISSTGACCSVCFVFKSTARIRCIKS